MLKRISIFLFITIVFLGCSNHPLKSIETGRVEGTVVKNNNPVVNAYIFWEDSLMATTDTNGRYQIADLEEKGQTLLCSALWAKDLTMQVQIEANQTNTVNFTLISDSTIGRVQGEFQDSHLFNQKISEIDGLGSWNEKEVYEGMTGATLTAQYVNQDTCLVSLGDSLIVYDDGWGQYWFKMQIGTYPITGSIKGYHSKTRVVTITPEPDRSYCNFHLNRK